MLKSLPEYLEVVILLFGPALPLGLPQALAGVVRLYDAGSDVDGGGLAQRDLDALRPDIGRVGGVVQDHLQQELS